MHEFAVAFWRSALPFAPLGGLFIFALLIAVIERTARR